MKVVASKVGDEAKLEECSSGRREVLFAATAAALCSAAGVAGAAQESVGFMTGNADMAKDKAADAKVTGLLLFPVLS